MELSKNINFNFFKKSQPAWKNYLKSSLKRTFFLGNMFFILPAFLYKVLMIVPELKTSLPALLDCVSAPSYLHITLLLYSLYMMYVSCKDLFGDKKSSMNYSAFKPIYICMEVGALMAVLIPGWRVLWTLVR